MGTSQTVEDSVMGWLKRTKGAKYTNVSPRTLDKMFRNGLRHVKLPSGTILTRPNWIDEYLEAFEVQHERDQLDVLVEEMIEDVLDGGHGRQ